MTRAELRRQMREQKKALRASMAQLRRQTRAELEKLPAVRKERSRRRQRRLGSLAVLLLLLLFVRCDCAEAPKEVGPVVQVEPAAEKPPVSAPVKPPPPPPMQGKVERQPRGKYQAEARPRPKWLEAFHLQVSARSPRLARCFTGTDRPGALRWAAALNAKSGAVSDHELEPLGAPTNFTQKQSECVLAVLSSPGYSLEIPASEPLPNRVGLVIEF